MKISKGYEDISVEVIDYNMKLAEHAWNCYRMTWKELQNVDYHSTNKKDISKINEAISNIIEFKALPMPREQGIITFRINNISRVCLAQITRQRKACFNVESQMPRPVEHNVIVPLNIATNKDLNKEAKELIEKSQEFYNKCISKGIPPQDARYLLMHGQTTSLVYVVDINTFVGSFGMRCENNLSDEINLVYRLCRKAILNTVYTDFNNGMIDSNTFRMYTSIINNADCMGAKQKKGMNYDKVFGNSFERYPSCNREVADITENAEYDYKKSAWYLEMQKLPDDLLFPDEKEMIKKWKN